MWMSDDAMTDFYGVLSEFEREANPLPARLRHRLHEPVHAGRRPHSHGRHARAAPPVHSRREGAPQINEPERLEFLVHELGHYLGASHSPENDSVMRPVLGDNRAGRSGFRIRFDPVNTLVMAMVSEEMRRNDAVDLAGVSTDTKRRLRQIYGELARTFPDDPASQHFVQLMGSSGRVPLSVGAKHVLDEICPRRAGEQNAADAARGHRKAPKPAAPATAHRLLRAAGRGRGQAASRRHRRHLVPAGAWHRPGRFANAVRDRPTRPALAGAVETPRERAMRLSLLGEPTIHGRRDLAQHFFISAHLAAAMGATAAEAAGLSQGMLDAHGESGFSFADIAADRAGIEFARRVMDKRLTLPMLAQTFSVAGVRAVASKDLPEKLNAVDFAEQYGEPRTTPDSRSSSAIIDQRILKLPPYRVPDGDRLICGNVRPLRVP